MPRIRRYDEFSESEDLYRNLERNEKKERSLAEVETNGPETKNGIIKKLLVNVRREPDLESDVLEVLQKGDKVTILEKTTLYYKVVTRTDRVGYIFCEFVEEE